ncbi:MAG: DUF3108 domain-containing protein [Rhizobiales bacterium]|nr:DUF3108 domain-containing protein [Hyphomicrobiales bacterium]
MTGLLSTTRRRAGALAAALLVALGAAGPGGEDAQDPRDGTLKATYTMLLNGVTIGRFDLDAAFDHARYTLSIRGKTAGVSAMVSDGTGLLKSSGQIAGARILPGDYYLDTTENGKSSSNVSMRMKQGTIVSVAALPPLPVKADRVPLLPVHRHNIVDPLSAMMVPLKRVNMGAACNRSIPVFDGWQRFDVKLFYKSTAQVQGEGGSYSGPVVVCGARYVPVAGHRPTREAVKFMENNKQLEVWLAPVDDLGVMLPFRMQIGTEAGLLTIHASRFVGQAAGERAALN